MERQLFDADHDAFRETVRAFCDKEVVPHHDELGGGRHRAARAVGGGRAAPGLLGFMVPEEYGGGGVARLPVQHRADRGAHPGGRSGVGFTIHTDINSAYLLDYATDEQKARWLPGVLHGRD